MNDRPSCATPEALVTYLYEECDPAERTSIAAHVATCSWCADEVRALSDTRAHLASWSPPALPLGFQITRTESDQPAKVLRPAVWWRQPLPAWAQAAAAVVIFAAGMSVNAFRSSSEPLADVVQSRTPQSAAAADVTSGDDLSVTRAEFARLDARLRAMERADVSRASYAPDSNDYDDLRFQLSTLTSRVAMNERQNSDFRQATGGWLDTLRQDTQASQVAAQRLDELNDQVQQHRKVLLTPGLLQLTALTNTR
jgi:anti-sigma factor RsiW